MNKRWFETLRASCSSNQMCVLIIGTVLLVVLASGATYLLTKQHYENLLAEVHPIFVPDSPYTFLRPLVGIHVPGDLNSTLTRTKSGIRSIISQEPAGTVTRYSVYLRDLGTGNWTGINENDTFDPASMLKVVIAIAAYRQAEKDPDYLTHWLTYTSDVADANSSLPYSLGTSLTVGHSYSVPYLIRAALVDSDNGAAFTLLKSIRDEEIDGVYDDLSVREPNKADSSGYRLSALEYSRFFRILYNGTLSLNWDHSEQILRDLTQATFVSGLVAGVPASIPVAHKYGEHVSTADGQRLLSLQLSDCGIVYYPDHPYFLCVMLEGKDPDALAKVIARVSRYTYDHIATGTEN